MPEVDPDDDRGVRHYTYDSERRELRHKVVAAFSRATQADALMRKLSDERQTRAIQRGPADPQDYFSVAIWQSEYRRLQANARLLRAALARGVSVERAQDS